MQTTTEKPSQQHADQDDIEDLEICSREGRHPRCVRSYRIKIDKHYHVVHVSYMTGWQLLELGGACDPRKWKIRQKMADGSLKISPLMKRSISPPQGSSALSPCPAIKPKAKSANAPGVSIAGTGC